MNRESTGGRTTAPWRAKAATDADAAQPCALIIVSSTTVRGTVHSGAVSPLLEHASCHLGAKPTPISKPLIADGVGDLQCSREGVERANFRNVTPRKAREAAQRTSTSNRSPPRDCAAGVAH